jgi:nucleoside-diphosphate-sugar epimerase
MRVLVIGGTGLISTAIVRRLLQDGHEPILFNRGQSPCQFREELDVVNGDRNDFADFAQKVEGLAVDAVIDMLTFDAATARNAVEVFSGRIWHYLFCSTVCVYGPLTRVPASEDEPHKPVSPYGTEKSRAEQVFMEAFRDASFPVTIFRPSHCYGPGQPLLDIWGYNPTLVTRIREGGPIIVPGDGVGLWQPCLTSDVAKGFVGALELDRTKGRAYNIVGDEVMEWRAFHERMARALGHEANIVTMTTAQILAGAPVNQSGMLDEIFQYHGAYTNDALKRDVPAFRDLVPWEKGVQITAHWMDENKLHQPAESQPWIARLAAMESDFRDSLAREQLASLGK